MKKFIGYEESEHEVLEVWEIDTGKQIAISKEQSQKYRFTKHIKLKNNDGLITAQIFHWQGDELIFENIKVKLSGDVEEQIIEIDNNGLQLEGTGLAVTVESINEKVQNDSIEVVL